MKTAVLMATYNGENYLREQIESILRQELSMPFDLIVRDDGSTDGTGAILQEYAEAGKIKLLTGENVGAARGFIELLRRSRDYDYYAFSDQDDVWNADKLQNGINAIAGIKGPALYCTNCEIVDSGLQPLGRNTHRKKPTYTLESILCLACCAQGCTSVFNQALASVVQEHPVPPVFIMHDSLLTCLCGLINGTIIYDEKPSMKYRIHGSNVSGMVSARQNITNTLRERLWEITEKKKVSMYEQAESLLNTYGEHIGAENRALCRTVIDSEKSLAARLRLVFNKGLKHDTLNKTITKKLEILFGND